MKNLGTPLVSLMVALLCGSGVLFAQQPAPVPAQEPQVDAPAEPAGVEPDRPPAEDPAAPVAAPEPEAATGGDVGRRGAPPFERRPEAVSVFQDLTIPAGEVVREAVVIMGDARIAGQVERDLVVVMGTAELFETASVGGDFVVVGGSARISPGVRVGGDVVAVGGVLDAPEGFRPGGQYVAVAAPIGPAFTTVSPWVQRGLLWGRPIVPELGWVWVVVGIVFIVYALLTLIFDRPVRLAAVAIDEKPLTAFGVGLLVMILVAPVMTLLAISVIGIVVIPFLSVAVLAMALVGRVATARWLGMRLVPERESDSSLPALRSLAIGFAILCVAYIVPVLGFFAWMLVGVFGLGGAALALMTAYRRENPPPDPGIVPPSPPPQPSPYLPPSPAGQALHVSPMVLGETGTNPDAQGSHRVTGDWTGPPAAEAGTADQVPLSPPPPAGLPPLIASPTAGVRTDLLGYPHATFGERLAAGLLDVILVAIVVNLLRLGGNVFVLLLLAYLIGFWAWRGTSVGGIIVQLRVARVDGAPLQLVDALVRGLSSLFSLAVVGLGFLWILRDPERQAWHDRIAGTYVVKVPRNYPL